MPFELLLTEPRSIAGSSARPGALAPNQVRAAAIVSDISDHVAAFGAETSSKPWLNSEITAVPTTRVGADRPPRRLPIPSWWRSPDRQARRWSCPSSSLVAVKKPPLA